MKLHLAVAAASFATLTTSSAAFAGCSNYADGSLKADAPKVTICVYGTCEDTTVEFECGNAHGAQIGYANGWRVDHDGEGTQVYRIVRVPKTAHSSVICTNRDDEEGCRFPANLKKTD